MRPILPVAASLAFVLGGCSNAVPSEPETIAQAKGPVWSGVEALVATSDVVLLGSVEGVSKGASFGEVDGELQYRDVTLRVERVVFSRIDQPSGATVQELGWVEGKSAEIEGMRWSTLGDRGYFFLRRVADGVYNYVGTQGRVLVVGTDVQPSGLEGLKTVARIDRMSADEFAFAVADASGRVNRDNLPKLPKGDGDAQ